MSRIDDIDNPFDLHPAVRFVRWRHKPEDLMGPRNVHEIKRFLRDIRAHGPDPDENIPTMRGRALCYALSCIDYLLTSRRRRLASKKKSSR